MTFGGTLGSSLLAGALALTVALTPATARLTTRASTPGANIGVQFHCTWGHKNNAERRAVVAKLAAAGVKTVRIDVAWAALQPTRPGRFNAWHLRNADRCVNLARAAGMEVLATLLWTPPWANGGRDRATPPTRAADFGRFARWAARHFRGRVSAYEVWNEPDHARFWRGDAARYVRLLRVAYSAIKAGDRNAKVVFAGTSHNNTRWISAAYRAGAKGTFDVMATHPYQGVGDEAPEVVGAAGSWWLLTHVAAVHELMTRRGDGRKPIWFTEFGWSTHENDAGTPLWQRGVTPETQAAYLVRAAALIRARFPYVERAFWYKAAAGTRDDPHEGGYGLLRADLSPRPAYAALKSILAR
jgi:polysaccharide biosynthesis protein PslG